MTINNSRQLKMGVILSYGQIFLNVIIQLVYTPLMIRYLGQSEYGLYNVVASTIQILSILNLGFNGSYLRFFSKYKRENDEESIHKLNGLFLIIFLVLGAIAFALGMFLTFRLDLVFEEGLTASEYGIAKWLMLLFTCNLAISFPATVFICIISAHERFIVLKALGMLKTVASPIITIPFLVFGYGSIAVVAVTIGISILPDTLYLFYVLFKIKSKFIFRDFEKGLFKSLLIFTSFIAINLIVDQVNNNMGKILLGRFKGTDAAAVYSVGYTLYQFYMLFSTSISGVFSPRVHTMIKATEGDPEKQRAEITSLFIRVGRMQFMILCLIAFGLLFFGKQFIAIWAGEEYQEAYYVMLLLVFSATIPLVQNLGIEIQRAINKHYFRSIAYLCMAVLNVIVTVLFVQTLGATGAALGTAISLIVANGLAMNIYYHKKCNIDIVAFWKSIARLFVAILPAVVFGTLVSVLLDLSNIWIFLGMACVYGGVYFVSLFLFGLNVEEKAFVKKILKRGQRNA